jgi:hypothetical protein
MAAEKTVFDFTLNSIGWPARSALHL